MSISVGGLGIISLRNPFADLVGLALGRGNLRLLFCLIVLCIITLVLAYLTNPTENSFRAYLTEQSFRHHLSRLDDATDEDQQPPHPGQPPSRRLSSRRPPSVLADPNTRDRSPPFHFASRAAVSLRTPKHVFHSFAVFTIAAMVPVSKAGDSVDRDGWTISDSWYIGAFGRWWRGGALEAWYQDVMSRSKDEESWSSGILSMKSLDMLQDYNGPAFSTKSLLPQALARGSPPRLRNRERSSQRNTTLPTRSLTPPPLPKTASLPLHTTTRLLATPSGHACIHAMQPALQPQPPSLISADPASFGSSLSSKSPSTLFDQSPLISEVLRQISASKASVVELRTQLVAFQNSAIHSHSVLQEEVNKHRDRKRQEDASKLELKSRTKILDDSKRNAESMKREAEKKLKAAENAQLSASKRMETLDKEIAQLQQRKIDDEVFIRDNQETVSELEREIAEALEHKKREIKVAEEVISALSQRSKELEEQLTSSKETLSLLRQKMENELHGRMIYSLDHHPQHPSSDIWPSPSYILQHTLPNGSTPSIYGKDERESLADFATIMSRDQQNQTASSTIDRFSNPTGTPNVISPSHSPHEYSLYEDSMVDLPSTYSTLHSTNDTPDPRAGVPILPSTTHSLLPDGLITPQDVGDNLSRSFRSEHDVFMEKDWRGNHSFLNAHHKAEGFMPGYPVETASPTSIFASAANDGESDPFEVRAPPAWDQMWDRIPTEQSMDMQRATWTHRSNSSVNLPEDGDLHTPALEVEKTSSRRWFSSREKPKKGLNPDAKEFSLSRKSPSNIVGMQSVPLTRPTYDALNPNGLGSSVMSSIASTNDSFLRAFAPSPAEREVLQRALGGSTNASFERLPSLSDVSSLPSSPSLRHVLPSVHHIPRHSVRDMGKVLPSWLPSLPRVRKLNFSPWDDEEPTPDATPESKSG